MRGNRFAIASALFVSALAAPAFAQIFNGGFETAQTAPVTPGDWQYNGGGVRDTSSPRTGAYAANLNNTSAGGNTNVQEQTVFGSITPGTAYTLSFYSKATYGTAGEGQLQIGFMNSGGQYLAGFPNITQIPASANYALTTRSLTAPANASAFFIAFNAVTGAVTGASSHLYVDDVALTSATSPEPATMAAIVAPALLLRRRRRA
jgi:hypothetical protein